MKVPLLDLDAQHGPIKEDLLAAIKSVIDRNAYIMGPDVLAFERRVAAYSQTRFALGVSSGTDALLVSLMALDVGPGDEVITTAYSFFATAGCIARVGAKPVFVDIDPVSYNIDPAKIEDAITPRTKAIIPVHLYGQVADMDPILDIASRHGLRIIEDAAQAIGADYRDGRRAGSMGDLGCLSFFPSKNLGAFGDGGMVLANDDALAEKVELLRVHGAKPKYIHRVVGGNFRLDTIQAAVLDVKLDYLDNWTKARQDNARRYEELFRTSGLIERVGIGIPLALYAEAGAPNYHIYNQYVIRVPRRDALSEYLKQEGVATAVYYPVPFHLQECFATLGYRRGDFPESERAANETLAIPVYPGVTATEQEYAVETIRAFYMS